MFQAPRGAGTVPEPVLFANTKAREDPTQEVL